MLGGCLGVLFFFVIVVDVLMVEVLWVFVMGGVFDGFV